MGSTTSTTSTARASSKSKERGPWVCILAQRDAGGEWETVGQPLEDVDFDSQAVAYDFCEKRNRRGNVRFDWGNDPIMAWVAVRADALGKLKAHRPIADAPAELAPVARGLSDSNRRRQNRADDGDEVDADEDDGGGGDEDEAGQMMLAFG